LFESLDDLTSQHILSENPRNIVISPRKNTIAWISDSTNINVIDLSSKGNTPIIVDGVNPITSLTYSTGGDRIVFSSIAKNIQVYDLINKSMIKHWNVPEWLTDLTYSPDGSEIAAGSLSNFSIYIFNAETGEINRSIEWEESTYSNLYGIYISPNWQNIAWVSKNVVQIMDMDTEILGPLLLHSDFVTNTVWSSDGKYIACSTLVELNGELRHTVKVWDSLDGNLKKEIIQNSSVQNITFSSDGSQIAVFDFEGSVNIWDID